MAEGTDEKALTAQPSNVVTLPSAAWTREQVELIKRTVAKGATDDELQLFLHYCRANKADPFRRQAYFIVREWRDKSGEKRRETVMMIGIDGFRSRAEQQPDFLGITSGAVRDGDEFGVDFGKGDVTHRAIFPRKGAILGAWARVCRRDRVPYIEWAEMAGIKDEYGFQWKKDPEGMCKKTVEARAIRHEYPEPFSTTYAFEEFGGYVDPVIGSAILPTQAGNVNTETGEVIGSEPSPKPEPRPRMISTLKRWCADTEKHKTIPWDHFANSMKAHHPDIVPEEESLDLLTEEEIKPLLWGFKARHPEYFNLPNVANGDKAPETAHAPSQTPDAPSDPEKGPEVQPSAPGAAERSLFPPPDEAAEQAKLRYEHLVTTARASGIPLEAGSKGVSLRRLIDECWPTRGDTDIWRIPVEVYDRVDARMTEIVNARPK